MLGAYHNKSLIAEAFERTRHLFNPRQSPDPPANRAIRRCLQTGRTYRRFVLPLLQLIAGWWYKINLPCTATLHRVTSFSWDK